MKKNKSIMMLVRYRTRKMIHSRTMVSSAWGNRMIIVPAAMTSRPTLVSPLIRPMAPPTHPLVRFWWILHRNMEPMAQRDNSGQIRFEVDDVYAGNGTQAEIVVRYKKDGDHPMLKYWRTNHSPEEPLSNNNPVPIPDNLGWYEATFTAVEPDFGSGNTHGYDFVVVSGTNNETWIDYVEVARQNAAPTPTPGPTATLTPSPTPEPAAPFRERMEVGPQRWIQFVIPRLNGATLTRGERSPSGGRLCLEV